ncbi:MAG: Nif3-like dinuclear metal center hexameric protein [Oscillospiraceae bacterium]|nr:Nif3-like dinuclear metal center hexameric protein [Oscillospiraceae bacterium]
MTTVQQIDRAINALAPFDTAMSFDNVGTLVGDPQKVVTKVLVSLDVTETVLAEAIAVGAQLIVTHHPVIFTPLKRLSADSLPYRLAESGIAVISAHTNYDLAPEGVNCCLANALSLIDVEPLALEEKTGLAEGLIGTLPGDAMAPEQFAMFVKERLGCGGVKYTVGRGPVKRVAVGCGAGSYLVFDAISHGADGFVTGESKHHELLAAVQGGLTMVDAGHFCTEDVAMMPLLEKLRAQFPAVQFQKSSQREPVRYV